MPALLDSRGRLTRYGFSCGYVEQCGDGVTIVMRHGVYHIRRHPSYGLDWQGARTLKDARRYAAQMKREAIVEVNEE